MSGLVIILVGAVALAVVAIVEGRKTSGTVLPVQLPSTGSGGPGVTAVQQETATGVGTVETVASDAATGNVVGAVTDGISGLLSSITQHSQRLANAKAENSAIPAAVQAFDADLQSIAAAYSSNQISAAQAANAVATLDSQILGYLRGLVGKPGTAWQVPVPRSMTDNPGAPCNSSCTASCCVYMDDLHSPLVAAYMFLLSGNVSQVETNAKPWLTSQYGGRVVGPYSFVLGVPKVYPPSNAAYGSFTRPAYSVSFQPSKSLPISVLSKVI